MKKGLKIFWVAVFSIFLLSGTAMAITIDFGTGLLGEGGFILTNGTYATGTGIDIGSMTVANNPYGFNGVKELAGVFLQFAYTPQSNFIRIYDDSGLDLLNGTFSTIAIVMSDIISVNGAGVDTKSEALLRELGIPSDTNFRWFGWTVTSGNNVSNDTPGYHTGTSISTDITNTSVVPEPTTMLLLGFGLVGLAGVRRKI